MVRRGSERVGVPDSERTTIDRLRNPEMGSSSVRYCRAEDEPKVLWTTAASGRFLSPIKQGTVLILDALNQPSPRCEHLRHVNARRQPITDTPAFAVRTQPDRGEPTAQSARPDAKEHATLMPEATCGNAWRVHLQPKTMPDEAIFLAHSVPAKPREVLRALFLKSCSAPRPE
jgi:hypothetical protein